MPRVLDVDNEDILEVGDVIQGLIDNKFDPVDEESYVENAYLLKGLYNNRTFLKDKLIDELKSNLDFQNSKNLYTPAVILLSDASVAQHFFLRANIWPSAEDSLYKRNGPEAFCYGRLHEHNFNFLTLGYFGPGYNSRYYESSFKRIIGYEGENVDLRFTGEHTLSPGKVQLYRAYLDVHEQLMPSSLSVSINVMEATYRGTILDQYAFDNDTFAVDHIYSNLSILPLFLLTAGLGGEDTKEILLKTSEVHPLLNVRFAALKSLVAMAESIDDVEQYLKIGIDSEKKYLRESCSRYLNEVEKSFHWRTKN